MCLHPLRIDGMSVQCGKCPECRLRRRNSHYVALCDIALRFKDVLFWTLTYDENNVPITDDGKKTLRREDLKLWFKKCRKLWQYHHPSEELSFKYWFVGEYGSQTGRPHYHGLTFGLTKSQAAFFADHWKKGFFYLDDLNTSADREKVIAYVLKYILKDYFAKSYDESLEKPRVMQSINMVQLSPEELAVFTGADLGLTQDDIPDIDTCLRINNRRVRWIGGFPYKLSERYVRKYFKEKKEVVDFWTGEKKISTVNTPLQDAIVASLQIKHVADYNEELRSRDYAVKAGLSQYEAFHGFAEESILHREENNKAAERKLRQIIQRDKF